MIGPHAAAEAAVTDVSGPDAAPPGTDDHLDAPLMLAPVTAPTAHALGDCSAPCGGGAAAAPACPPPTGESAAARSVCPPDDNPC